MSDDSEITIQMPPDLDQIGELSSVYTSNDAANDTGVSQSEADAAWRDASSDANN